LDELRPRSWQESKGERRREGFSRTTSRSIARQCGSRFFSSALVSRLAPDAGTMSRRQSPSAVLDPPAVLDNVRLMVIAPVLAVEGAERVLTAPALAFVEDLTRRFRPGIDELLTRRHVTLEHFVLGERPDFLAETSDVRQRDWTVGSIPPDLQDRRVEITGPADRKMIINALNSGAQVFMADFEDAMAPTWENIVGGQANLMDAVRRTISYEQPGTGKRYALNPTIATLLVRPRGFHLVERHCLVDDRPAPAMLFDFGMFLFHNADALARAPGPISTCRRCRATSRRVCGTTSSCMRRQR
jgi:malate synthase